MRSQMTFCASNAPKAVVTDQSYQRRKQNGDASRDYLFLYFKNILVFFMF